MNNDIISIQSMFANLHCVECPARRLLDINRSKLIENLRLRALDELNGVPEALILCESAPASRFVYDKNSDYNSDGLRAMLRNELTSDHTDASLFEYLTQNKVWIIDAALCPLHRLDTHKNRRKAATLCFKRHTRVYLDAFPEARVITIFPSNCGFLMTEVRDIANRIVSKFKFISLIGLRKTIEQMKGRNR